MFLGNCTSDFSVSNRLLADSTVHPAQMPTIPQPYYAWQAGSQQQEQSLYQHSVAHMQSYASSQTPVYHHSMIPSFEQQFNSNGTAQSATHSNGLTGNGYGSVSSIDDQEKLNSGILTIAIIIHTRAFSIVVFSCSS